jgi:hypothetical protein
MTTLAEDFGVCGANVVLCRTIGNKARNISGQDAVRLRGRYHA